MEAEWRKGGWGRRFDWLVADGVATLAVVVSVFAAPTREEVEEHLYRVFDNGLEISPVIFVARNLSQNCVQSLFYFNFLALLKRFG